MHFVVLSSSKGTVFQSVIDRLKDGSLKGTCVGLVADTAERGCVMKAKEAGLPVLIVERKKNESREDYDKRLDAAISSVYQGRDLIIACMGWMWILSPWFVSERKNRIINVHPALLPKHPGAHAHALVLAAKETESGMTIHLIDEGVDTGRILLQKTCPVLPDDTESTLKERVQALECEWYPKALSMIGRGELNLD